MKRYCFLILIFMLSLPACNEWIDENQFTYAIATSTFYNTVAEANAAVMAPLNTMRGVFNSNYFTVLEGNTEYCILKGVYSGYAHLTYNGVSNATHYQRNDANWQQFFIAILQCNMGIKNIPDANAMTDAEKTAYIAELRFLRALNYFHVVRRWGGVPLRTEDTMEQWDLEKSSVDVIYNFIIDDLKEAVANCPATPRFIGTPGRNAAKALLAEVYMYRGEYSEARRLAGEVISSGAYSLVEVSETRDFDKIFGSDVSNSSEEVFYIKTSRTDGLMWNYLSFSSHPHFEVEPGRRMLNGNGYWTHYTHLRHELIDEWDRDDLRFHLNIGHMNSVTFQPRVTEERRLLDFQAFIEDWGDDFCLFIKYWDPLASGDPANVAIPLIRYTDVLITYSEATARVAGAPTEESIEMLNKLRRRGYGYDPNVANPALDYLLADYSTMPEFIDLLIKEQRYERMNEAKHWDFIVRLGKEVELVTTYYYRFHPTPAGPPTEITQRHYLWRIPDAEFNYNKALDKDRDQNPGYNNL